MSVQEYITLVKYVLLKIQLDTNKLVQIKLLQDLNYIKVAQNM